MALNILFSSNDWHVEEAPIVRWGYNMKGTFTIVINRYNNNGEPFEWTMNVPEFMVGELPNILDNLPEDQRQQLRFTGGWQGRNAEVTIGLAE